jgi:thymidylate kinase
MNKSRIIHIDGVDKTGKDTVRDLIVKNTAGNTLVVVRSYLSQIAYSRLYGRKIDEEFFFNKMKLDYDNGVEFVVLECNLSDADKRFKKHNETDINLIQFDEHKSMFRTVIADAWRRGIKIAILDTSTDTPDETYNKILKS